MNALAPADLPDAELRVARLRAPLLAELRCQRRAAALRPAGALGMAIVALALALAAFGLSRGSEPALAIERVDGTLVLRITDPSAGEAALTRDLREAGIRGEVRLLPVAAAEVGTWAIISEHAHPPGEAPPGETPAKEHTVRLDRVRNEGTTLRIPVTEVRQSTGYFIFYAGREALPGEPLKRDGQLRYAPE